jgi:hypothetical protein
VTSEVASTEGLPTVIEQAVMTGDLLDLSAGQCSDHLSG